jgi:hypothetical protein
MYSIDTKEKVENILIAIMENNIKILENDFVDNIENIETGLTQLDDFFINNNLLNAQLVDCSFETFTSIVGNEPSSRVTKFVYNIVLENGPGVLYIDIVEENEIMKIRTLRVNQLEKSMEESHNFYGMQMNSTRIFLLIFTVALILFIMYTEFDYFRISKNRKIWLQILMPISGLAFSINWNTLILNISVLHINITPVSLFSPGIMGEWRLTFFIPIIAILYWTIFRKKAIHKEKNILDGEHVA